MGKSLAELNPELAKMWHPSKNGELTPFDVTPGSSKNVWWKCIKGYHEWYTDIYEMSIGLRCPYCAYQKTV